MKKVVILISIMLIISLNYYAQFGYKSSENGDFISNKFIIKEGFKLDSVTVGFGSGLKVYKFEYYPDGKLKCDFNFAKTSVSYERNGRTYRKDVPGYRDYFYNERGDVDSIFYRYWNDSVWVDTSGYRIEYTYNSQGNIFKKIYLQNGILIARIEENNYDSSGNLILNKVILTSTNDTTINFREYDALNRVTLYKSVRVAIPSYEQYIFQYDSVGNINRTVQKVNSNSEDSLVNSSTRYFEFDDSGKLLREVWSRNYNNVDSTWFNDIEFITDYDQNGNMLSMGNDYRFHYNSYGNLDTLLNLHPFTYLAGRVPQLLDSYGNTISLTNSDFICYFHYSEIATSIQSSNKNIVNNYHLSQNYPNPFNPTTNISFFIPEGNIVSLKIYDILGRHICTLVNEFKNVGQHEVKFNSQNLASGVYFYSLKSGKYIQTKKLIILR